MLDQRTRRVVIERVTPEVDGGRFAIKRTVGESVLVEADILADGHDTLSAMLLYRRERDVTWTEIPMEPLANDRWRATFTARELGRYRYTLEAWVDAFKSWRRDLGKKLDADQDVSVDLLVGAELIEAAARQATGADATKLLTWALTLRSTDALPSRAHLALDDEVAAVMASFPDRRLAARYVHELALVVDRERARFGSWYELFPRSCAPEPGRHGTFADCEARLPYLAAMGFDVLYLPPIHPIGRAYRKGRNNTVNATHDDVGSPWAIGAQEGGHKAVHPALGTLEDFRRLVLRAREHRIEVALDLAFQCAPDHPYVKLHAEWFRRRPDGTIRHAENPPKKYQDIVPFDFDGEDWAALWRELKSVVRFWIDQGVSIFRVDNPHTKPFPFWEWLITDVKADHPDVIFLSEAFTRPKVMYELAKLGFTQSYTYFAWRNLKDELVTYFTHLTQSEVCEYFRPNLWPNTPDILTEFLQAGGRPAFVTRLVLAATLGASYGIYGPVFELGENRPLAPGSEEYLDSEKYEVRHWELARPDSLADLIGRVNRIRRENGALQQDRTLRFHPVDHERLICYSKHTADGANVILVVVNLDPYHRHAGWVELDLDALGLDAREPYQVHDLLTDARYLWQGPRNYIELDPGVVPAHVLRVRRRIRREHDFEYYL
jgi:starch synthase (maltosyl-transferring)